MAKVRALTNLSDIYTSRWHLAGEVYDLDRPVDELIRQMHNCLIEILDPAIKPAIQIEAREPHKEE